MLQALAKEDSGIICPVHLLFQEWLNSAEAFCRATYHSLQCMATGLDKEFIFTIFDVLEYISRTRSSRTTIDAENESSLWALMMVGIPYWTVVSFVADMERKYTVSSSIASPAVDCWWWTSLCINLEVQVFIIDVLRRPTIPGSRGMALGVAECLHFSIWTFSSISSRRKRVERRLELIMKGLYEL